MFKKKILYSVYRLGGGGAGEGEVVNWWHSTATKLNQNCTYEGERFL